MIQTFVISKQIKILSITLLGSQTLGYNGNANLEVEVVQVKMSK
jgi:hypothetical protein